MDIAVAHLTCIFNGGEECGWELMNCRHVCVVCPVKGTA